MTPLYLQEELLAQNVKEFPVPYLLKVEKTYVCMYIYETIKTQCICINEKDKT